jgi:hypothetical protein
MRGHAADGGSSIAAGQTAAEGHAEGHAAPLSREGSRASTNVTRRHITAGQRVTRRVTGVTPPGGHARPPLYREGASTVPGCYFGGPLDGQPARKHRGKWSTYLDETGKPMSTKQGDALVVHHTPPLPLAEKTVYLFDEAEQAYVWIPDWRAWRRRPLTASAT